MYSSLLFVHIVAGCVACICAAGALWVAKGRAAHARWGKAYALAMGVIVLTSFAMAYLKPNVFLAFVGAFTAFLLSSGWVRAKHRSGKPSRAEWVLAMAGVVVGAAMVAVALREPFRLQIAMVAFGGITLLLALRDIYSLKTQRYKGAPRIAAHLTYMLGGTIANVTAVTVVNWQSNPAWVAWLAPSAVLVPLIVYWNVKTIRAGKAAAR